MRSSPSSSAITTGNPVTLAARSVALTGGTVKTFRQLWEDSGGLAGVADPALEDEHFKTGSFGMIYSTTQIRFLTTGDDPSPTFGEVVPSPVPLMISGPEVDATGAFPNGLKLTVEADATLTLLIKA